MDSYRISAPAAQWLATCAVIFVFVIGVAVILPKGEIAPAVAAEREAMTQMAKEIATLEKGDFLLTTENKVVLILQNLGQSVRVAHFPLQQIEDVPTPASIAAKWTKRVVHKNDPDWPETAKRFLTQ